MNTRRVKKLDWQTELITENVDNKAIVINKRKSNTLKIATDRWENYANGFGMIGRDPVASTFYNKNNSIPLFELEALYRHDWLTQRIIETLPDAAVQRGFVIKSEEDEKGAAAVTDLLKEWKTKTKAKHLAYQARLYGGAAKVNYVNDGMPTAYPINWKMIKSIDQSKILGRFYCRPWIFYNNQNDLSTFGKPWIYQVFEVSYNMMIPVYQVHESRLSWMDGTYLPDHLKISNWGAGDSVMQRPYEAAKAHGSSIQALSATIQDFVTKVLQIEDMADLLEENEAELEYRVRMANAKTSIHNTAVIGPEEKLFKISTPITHLPQSIVILMDVVSAAAKMPKSQLFGNMTGTLGSSSGKYDRSNWDNQTETFQNETLTPIIEDDMRLACAILGVNFDDLELKWNDVKEKGEKETAETRKLNAEAEKIEIENERARAAANA